ncbi:MAG: hypothetical protein J6O43_07135 [Clostridium sp.]|nr:hypothetical protein [Clostridium sp.]
MEETAEALSFSVLGALLFTLLLISARSLLFIIAATGILLVFSLALVFSVDYREEDSEESMENAESPDDEEDAIGFYLVGARKKQKKEES